MAIYRCFLFNLDCTYIYSKVEFLKFKIEIYCTIGRLIGKLHEYTWMVVHNILLIVYSTIKNPIVDSNLIQHLETIVKYIKKRKETKKNS